MRTRRMDPFIRVNQEPPRPAAPGIGFTQKETPVFEKTKSGIADILSQFKKDDYILAGIIGALIFEGCDDYILLAALGYLFIVGFFEADPIATLLENFLQ